MQGGGGCGKTTLAIDSCHQPGVVKAFPDGLLWVTLGEKPDLEQVLHNFYVVVTGVLPIVYGRDATGEAIAQALRGRHCLIVVDDAWRTEDLQPFLRLDGPRLLVTTRLRMLLEEAGQVTWCEVPVDEMKVDEAVALLGRGLAREASASDALQGLAVRLGCWPLLLELVNARIRKRSKNA